MQPKLKFGERRKAVVAFLTQSPGSTIEEVAKGLNMSLANAHAAIRAYFKRGLITRRGAGLRSYPHRYYVATHYAPPQPVRPIVRPARKQGKQKPSEMLKVALRLSGHDRRLRVTIEEAKDLYEQLGQIARYWQAAA